MPVRPQVLLVHGAWHGGWVFDPLLPHLEQAGLGAAVVELPSAGGDGGLAADAAVVRAAIGSRPGPTLVVGHSYGGIVISEGAAGLADVSGLVFICALQLDVGESWTGGTGGRLPRWVEVDEAAGTTRVPDPVPVFYDDLDPATARRTAARLTTQTLSSTTDALTRAAWHDIPSTYVICERDKAFPPDAQEAIAARSGTVRRLDSGHSPFLSHPAELAALLATAVA